MIKTIRLRLGGLESWLRETDVKVVHWVRDPRAMITSMAKKPGTWSDTLRNATFQCRRMLEDSKLEALLPSERYIKVRYEDLVELTNTTLSRIYDHLGLPYTAHVQKVAFARTHAENITGTNGLVRSGEGGAKMDLFLEMVTTTHSEKVTSPTTLGRRSSV